MNSVFIRLNCAEATIRRYLGQIAEYETMYVFAKTDEIAKGVNPRAPFLKSKQILNGIRFRLKAARAAQNKYNRWAINTRHEDFTIDLLETTIEENSIFNQSKIIMREAKEHAMKTEIGIMAKESLPWTEGPRAIDTVIQKDPNIPSNLKTLYEHMKKAEDMTEEDREKYNKSVSDPMQDIYSQILQSVPELPVEEESKEEEKKEEMTNEQQQQQPTTDTEPPEREQSYTEKILGLKPIPGSRDLGKDLDREDSTEVSDLQHKAK